MGDAAGVVGDEGEADFVVADVDVGVVVLLLGEFGNPVDEGDGLDEVWKLIIADEFAIQKAPVRKLRDGFIEFGLGEGCHVCGLGSSFMRGTPLPFGFLKYLL